MKNKLLIQRPKSEYSKKYLTLHTKQSMPILYNDQMNNYSSENAQDQLNDFFDNFHENYIVVQDHKKCPLAKSKREKPSLSQFIANKQRKKKQNVNKSTKNNMNEFHIPQKQKSYSQKIKIKDKKNITHNNKSVLVEQKKKNCHSEKNLLLTLKQTAYAFLLKSSKNSVKKKSNESTNKSINKSIKRFDKNNDKVSKKNYGTKQKFMRTGSTTASNGLGNSTLINFKEDIHIANYLRLKINA